MAGPTKTRSLVKCLFWTVAAAVILAVIVHSFRSGQMTRWYYHSSSLDGYAVNADSFRDADDQRPAVLTVGQFERIDGLQAVPVRKGDRLPRHANGVIATTILEERKRALLDGDRLVVKVPWEIKTAKGFKFKDTFKHKGVKTYPWSAVWNVAVILALGICLGFMAEGLTDLVGLKLSKIRHFEGH